MGEVGCEKQLLNFINAVMKDKGKNEFKTIKIIENKELTPEIIDNKLCQLDVRAILDNNTEVNIEVQLVNKDDFEKRIVYYMSKSITNSLEKGKKYGEIPNMINISIVDFNLTKINELNDENSYHIDYHLLNCKFNSKLTDALQIHIIQMSIYRKLFKQDKINIEDNEINQWACFFDPNTPKRNINDVIEMNSGIKTAKDKINFIKQHKDLYDQYMTREMAKLDYESEISYKIRESKKEGKEEGIKEGKEEGKKEAIIETALNLKNMGISLEDIKKATGLILKEIKNL
jgi:predicted transposase/invertase (TIGR01784 family)